MNRPSEQPPQRAGLEAVTGHAVERRRIPRLSLTSEQFRLKQTGKIFSVADLSSEGMALRILDAGDLLAFPVGAEVEGILNLKKKKLVIHGRVKNIRPDLVGFQFEGLDSHVAEEISKLLDPEILGAELRPIPGAEGGALWYHGTSGTDLLLWRAADGQYSRFFLQVLGTFIQWDGAEELATGRVRASEELGEARGIFRHETALLDFDAKPDAGKLGVAKTLVLSSNLPQELIRWFVRQLQEK